MTCERICRTETEQGVCLMRLTVCYPAFEGTASGILHINAFEKQYAEALVEGMISTHLPSRRAALDMHLSSGGRRSRFPTFSVELKGQGAEEVGRFRWSYTCQIGCGGERCSERGERLWDEEGLLL